MNATSHPEEAQRKDAKRLRSINWVRSVMITLYGFGIFMELYTWTRPWSVLLWLLAMTSLLCFYEISKKDLRKTPVPDKGDWAAVALFTLLELLIWGLWIFDKISNKRLIISVLAFLAVSYFVLFVRFRKKPNP